MPDIQMCTAMINDEDGKTLTCKVKNECYRHTANPGMMQSWGGPAGDFMEIDGCDNYIPVGFDKTRVMI